MTDRRTKQGYLLNTVLLIVLFALFHRPIDEEDEDGNNHDKENDTGKNNDEEHPPNGVCLARRLVARVGLSLRPALVRLIDESEGVVPARSGLARCAEENVVCPGQPEGGDVLELRVEGVEPRRLRLWVVEDFDVGQVDELPEPKDAARVRRRGELPLRPDRRLCERARDEGRQRRGGLRARSRHRQCRRGRAMRQ